MSDPASPAKKGMGCGTLLGFGLIALLVFGFIMYMADKSEKDVKAEKAKYASVSAASTLAAEAPKFNPNPELAKSLKSHFRIKKDEFNGTYRYEHKSAPEFVNQNGVYVFFLTNGEGVTPDKKNMFFSLQYYGDDWLFIKSVDFLIDGQRYYFQPSQWKHDNDSKVWEWTVDRMGVNEDIVAALKNAKVAKMRLNGQKYNKDKVITAEQLKAIRETCQYFEALGGQIIE